MKKKGRFLEPKKLDRKCLFCNGEIFVLLYSQVNRKKLCSRSCSSKYKCIKNTGFSFKGRNHSLESKAKMSLVRKGFIPYNKGKHITHSGSFKKGVGSRRCLDKLPRGEKSHLWKGGISPLNKLIRGSSEYKKWRELVFERDNYTCQNCKIRGGELHPDHIKPFSLFPELRFEISNGRTLCASCHRKTNTWGVKIRFVTREQFCAKITGAT